MYDNQHIPWDISQERRNSYSTMSRESQAARKRAEKLAEENPNAQINADYDPSIDMPQLDKNGLRSLSLFSGGGGLDLGFDKAGFEHVASYEVLKFAGQTLTLNRPSWDVKTGIEGDVRGVDWAQFKGQVDVLHGGPPCQPFSIAGRRAGQDDTRDMFPQFIRAVEEAQPSVFLAENVMGFLSKKFEDYRKSVLNRLGKKYNITTFALSSAEFGVPQDRRRVFIVGSLKSLKSKFTEEAIKRAPVQRGVKQALGFEDLAGDGFAPTLRCTLTGPRQTTSIANSTASVAKWTEYGIWPHGVSPNRSVANSFPTKNSTYRLCVEECQLIQGFPLDWKFDGAVYQRLGLIGNSVCPPVSYAVAKSIVDQLFRA